MSEVEKSPNTTGPFFYQNWQAAKEGATSQGASEYPLFTDVHIIGEVLDEFGPYQLFNTVPFPSLRSVRPPLVLRVENFLTYEGMPMETNDGSYHGGYLQDEIAAVISLNLGIRVKSGSISRTFDPDNSDPRGHPAAYGYDADPVLPRIVTSPIIPYEKESYRLDELALLSKSLDLLPDDAMALVRAARLYQDGLWLTESQPELTWLMLVSAVETAAQYWRKSKDSDIERLRMSRPELEKLLIDEGRKDLVASVAEMIAPYMGDKDFL